MLEGSRGPMSETGTKMFAPRCTDSFSEDKELILFEISLSLICSSGLTSA